MTARRPLVNIAGSIRELPTGDSLLATNGYPVIRPALNLDFANSKTLDPRITFSRASSATYTDADGLIKVAAAGEARFDHDPITGECRGLLIESARTNLLINSTVDGNSLATQDITVTAAPRTLSFYGTGTVVLSGAHNATVVGTGDYPVRTVYTYTPTAGTLTLTVSGTVQYANDELGSFATSFIPTAGVALTRSADLTSMTGANFSSWFNLNAGTFVVTADTKYTPGEASSFLNASNGSVSANQISIYANDLSSVKRVTGVVTTGGATVTFGTNSPNGSYIAGSTTTAALAYATNDVQLAEKGSLQGSNDTTVPLPTAVDITSFQIGSYYALGNRMMNGHINRIAFYPKRLSTSELQAVTMP
jgi:hypothetical protein